MPRVFRLLALALLIPLAGCGIVGDEEENSLSNLSFLLTDAKDCVLVHGAVLQASFAPLALSEGPPDAAETIEHLRGMAEKLPLDDAGQPSLRNAFRNIADMVEGVVGKGPKAAAALVQSPRYRRQVAVLGAWYTPHCNKEEAAPSGK